MNSSISHDTPIPFQNVPERTYPIDRIADEISAHEARVILVGIHGDRFDRKVRIARITDAIATQFLACEGMHEIRVRGYYAVGRRVFLTGNARLRDLLEDPTALDMIADAFRRRRDPETGVAPSQMRFAGELECCLLRQNGRWTDLTPNGNGPAVVGSNIQDGVVYAIRLRADGASLEIVMAENSEDPVMNWRRMALGFGGKRILDASRFVRDSDGNVVSIVTLEGPSYHLLTRRGTESLWSESVRLPGSPIECDAASRTILTQCWVHDGYLVSRQALNHFNGLVLLAYWRAHR